MFHALTHADIFTTEGIISDGAVVIGDDGYITDVDPETLPAGCTEHDLQGAFLAPGLIDLHCDAIEKIHAPRPNAAFPLEVSLDQTDRVNAMAGITTAFHAISFGQEARPSAKPHELASGISWLHGKSLVDHRLHCRYEIACQTSLDVISDMIKAGQVSMVSLMDHSPGQGQFKDIESFCAYYTKAHGLTHDQALAMAREKHENRSTGHGRALELTETAMQHGIQVASHDDDTPERIAAVHTTGVTIAEFPINLATAQAATATGMATILGAPNILRGGSQSGSMRALDAVIDGCCTCLCSDYAPWALLPAAWSLPSKCDLALHQAWDLVSGGPARAAGLNDRGLIEAGLRADLVAVVVNHDQPRVVGTWCHGRNVHRIAYPPIAEAVPA